MEERKNHETETEELKNQIHSITSDENINMQQWGSYLTWDDEKWEHLYLLATSDTFGEQLMKLLGYKRRKDLEVLFYHLSQKFEERLTIRWELARENGQHSLPPLKSGKNGLLISNERFKRYGLDVPAYTNFEMQFVSDQEFRLIINCESSSTV